jgi:hypothetical protein
LSARRILSLKTGVRMCADRASRCRVASVKETKSDWVKGRGVFNSYPEIISTRYAGAIPNWRNIPHSNTPPLRVAGFEDEDENENEAPFEAKGPDHVPGF